MKASHRAQKSACHPLTAGISASFIQKVTRVRNALDRRVVRAIHKDRMIPDRTLAAIQKVRVGNLAGLHLLHLIDMDDSGKRDDPLRAFEKMTPESASKLFLKCASMLKKAITFATPMQTASAVPFVDALTERICEAMEDGVPMKPISKWCASLFPI